MIWNYQGLNGNGHQVAMDVKNLPESMGNQELHIRKYRIGHSTSNYHVNLEKVNLQLVEEEQILPAKNYRANPFLEPNTL